MKVFLLIQLVINRQADQQLTTHVSTFVPSSRHLNTNSKLEIFLSPFKPENL